MNVRARQDAVMPEFDEFIVPMNEYTVGLPPCDISCELCGSVPSLNGSAALVREEYAWLHGDIERAANPSRCFVVGVTSALYGEGKTTVALNLAGTMAQNSDARVTLVDFNLRNWDMQTRLNLTSNVRLVDVLEGADDDLSAIVQPT